MLNACKMEALQLAARIILENGGETFRVEDTVERMGRAFGLKRVDVFAVPSGVFISITDEEENTQTEVNRLRLRGTNLEKVDQANRVSRQVAAGDLTPKEALLGLRKISAAKDTAPAWWLPLAVGASSAGFAVMFGGGPVEFLEAFFLGGLVQALTSLLGRLDMNQVMASLLGSCLCTLIPLFFHEWTGLGTVDVVVAGALMPLLPGLAMTNAVQDTMRGDMMSGVAHCARAILIAALVAGGALMAHRLFFLVRGG